MGLAVMVAVCFATPVALADGVPVHAGTAFRTTLAVQTLLDRENLSCGCLDGIIGPRTRAALQAWQRRRGLPATGEIDAAVLEAVNSAQDLFTTHCVTSNEIAALTGVFESWLEKARAERLGYGTILEAIAEQYHASEAAIVRLNPEVAWPNPPAGTVLVVPNPCPAAVGKAARLVVEMGRKLLLAFDEQDNLLAMFPCSIAARVEKRPTGVLRVVNCASDPEYLFDPVVFPEDAEARTINSRLVIPPGPNNPVGVAWIGLSLPGYGIHGTPRPEDIGKTESHGCLRLANWNAARLLKMISIGIPVVIEDGQP